MGVIYLKYQLLSSLYVCSITLYVCVVGGHGHKDYVPFFDI